MRGFPISETEEDLVANLTRLRCTFSNSETPRAEWHNYRCCTAYACHVSRSVQLKSFAKCQTTYERNLSFNLEHRAHCVATDTSCYLPP